MRGRGPLAALSASPTMVGAITTLIAVVAVFLAYNANNGLPFVSVYRVSVEIPNSARLVRNNEVRLGGHRVGVVESIEAVRASESVVAGSSDGRQRARGGRRAPQPQARQGRPAAAQGLDLPGPLPVLVRPQVPRYHPRRRRSGARGLHVQRDRRRQPALDRGGAAERRDQRERPVHRSDRVRRHRQHLQRPDP